MLDINIAKLYLLWEGGITATSRLRTEIRLYSIVEKISGLIRVNLHFYF